MGPGIKGKKEIAWIHGNVGSETADIDLIKIIPCRCCYCACPLCPLGTKRDRGSRRIAWINGNVGSETMKTKIKDLKKSQKQVRVELEWPEVEKYEKEVVAKISQEMDLSGFRKGKAPGKMVRKKAGEQKVLAETAKRAMEQTYRKLVREKGLEPISRPEVEVLKLARGNPFEFKATFTVLPEVNLPDYEKIAKSVEKREKEVKQEEIEDTLEYLQKARPRLKQVFRPAKEGDFLEITFFSPQLQKGKKFEDAFVLGKGSLIPGFEQELVGLEPGENKAFTLRLPKNFRVKEKAGKQARFNVTVKAVKKREKREINDEFARALGEFEDLDALKKSVRKGLRQEKKRAEKKRRQSQILEKITEKVGLEVPAVLVEREKEKRAKDIKKRAEKRFESFQGYLEEVGKSRQEFETDLRKEARQRAERFLVLREIAEKEDVKASEEEVEKEVQKILSRYPDPDRAKKEIDPEELKSYTEEKIVNQKTLNLLENF